MEAAKAEIDALSPAEATSRRRFLVTSLATGFAAATLPVAAQTMIRTPADGLIAGEVKVPVPDGEIPAYRAMPASGGAFPVVLVVQEIFGVHEHIKDICRRFARLGYFAIAGEMFARQGDVSKMTEIARIQSEVVSKVPDAQVMADLDALVEYARKSGKGNVEKLAITGFCWGGRITWLYVAHNQNVKAAGAWYGRLEGNRTPLTPQHPIDVVPDINAPVLGLYGDADAGIPVESVERMKEALAAAWKPSQIVLFKDAPHAFFADYRPSYRKQAAEEAWAMLLAWFRRHGVS
ncbi:MAG: dienelactone hydrolase family protein [Casimicrobiaceae bacterium]|nr:dienelactone hydrolase family protein [Casimicrobiaceae bacterium]MCX8099060.1 dienelactone hydrolase family protein [Casimicrobiaceae bacterium]